MDERTFINILSLILSCSGLILSVSFLLFIYINFSLKTNIQLALICNTYLTEMTSSILQIDSCFRTIFSIANPSLSDNGIYCQIRAYFLYAFISNVTYSFVIQAVFQYTRVVHHQKRSLQTFRMVCLVTICQWIFVLLINLLFFPLKEFIYLENEYRCLISYENTRGSILVFLFAYLIPTNLLCTIYFSIFRSLRQNHVQNLNRHFTRHRDLAVFKRILGIFATLQFFSTPLAVIWIIYIITGRLILIIYQLQALTAGLTQVSITIFMALTTPQIRNKFRCRKRRIHPVVQRNFLQRQIPNKMQIQRF